MRRILILLLIAILFVVLPSPKYEFSGLHLNTVSASGKLERCADLVADVAAGTFVWAGSAQTCTANNKIINRATFISWISNTGSCAGSGSYYQLRRDEMIACRVVSSTLTALVDPWLDNTSTSWPTFSGSPVFTTLAASSITGQDASAKYVSAASASTNTAVIRQAIVPSSVASGTQIVARAYLLVVENSVTTIASDCVSDGGTLTADSTASIEIMNSGGTVVANTVASAPPTTGWVQTAVSYTAPSTGTYYVAVSVTNNKATGTTYTKAGGCHAVAASVQANAEATGLSVANT